MWAGPNPVHTSPALVLLALGRSRTNTPLSQLRYGQFGEKVKQMKTKFSSLLPIKLVLKDGDFYQEAKRFPNLSPRIRLSSIRGQASPSGGWSPCKVSTERATCSLWSSNSQGKGMGKGKDQGSKVLPNHQLLDRSRGRPGVNVARASS